MTSSKKSTNNEHKYKAQQKLTVLFRESGKEAASTCKNKKELKILQFTTDTGYSLQMNCIYIVYIEVQSKIIFATSVILIMSLLKISIKIIKH